MRNSNKFIQQIIESINQHEVLAKELLHKVIEETNQEQIEEIKSGSYFLIEQSDSDQLTDGWNYEVHGEHCDFTNHFDERTLTVCLGNEESLNYLDPYFFHSFLKNTPKYVHLANALEPGFKEVYDLFEQLVDMNLMTKIEGLGPTFMRIK